jgi:predicted 3-demethylubiquinone-9 3-methyltransferase (glyoxalase superfamily)
MFQGRAEEAMTLYISLFPDGKVLEVVRQPLAGGQRTGSIARASFSIGGQTILCTDSSTTGSVFPGSSTCRSWHFCE